MALAINQSTKRPIWWKLRNRARLLLEIIASVRASFPNLLLSVRIPGQDFIEGGLTTQDMQRVTIWLEQAGVDLIDVYSGIGGWRRPGGRHGEGYLVNEAKAIQLVVSTPVIGVGGIKSGAYIDQVIGDGSISLAAVGRAILENPEQFRHQVADFLQK